MIWYKYLSNELVRLAQGGVNRVNGYNKIFFIQESLVLQDRKVKYGRIVCDIKPQK